MDNIIVSRVGYQIDNIIGSGIGYQMDNIIGSGVGYQMDNIIISVRFSAGVRYFVCSTASRTAGLTHRPIQWVPGVRQLGRETDQVLQRE
jgi:hypothetical protein